MQNLCTYVRVLAVENGTEESSTLMSQQILVSPTTKMLFPSSNHNSFTNIFNATQMSKLYRQKKK